MRGRCTMRPHNSFNKQGGPVVWRTLSAPSRLKRHMIIDHVELEPEWIAPVFFRPGLGGAWGLQLFIDLQN
jgi:hypothetical protein